jgi:hypothetical protein
MVYTLSLRFGDFLSALGPNVKGEKQCCNRFSASSAGPMQTKLRLFTLWLIVLDDSVVLLMMFGGAGLARN